MTTGLQISTLPTAPALAGNELVPLVTVGVITAITQAVNAVVTINAATATNPFAAGQQVSFASVGGMTQINGLGATVSAVGGVSGAWTITVPINSSGFTAYSSAGVITTTANTQLLSMRLSAGVYNGTFNSGPVQWAGPNGQVTSSNNFIAGTLLPNPSGIPGPCFLIGSGGGLGTNISAWIISDEAFDTSTPGNDLGRTAGEVQPGSTQRGGNLTDIGGAADLGTGGQVLYQGGTSARGQGGMAILEGGNNTNLLAPPGDVFVIAGETGSQGANAHFAATIVGGVNGVCHLARFNSTFVIDALADGELYFYGSNGSGAALAPLISRGPGQPAGWADSDNSEVITAVVPLAKLTPGGAQGSLTFVNGLLTAVTNPT